MGMIWTPKLIKPPLGTPLNRSDPINRGLILSIPMNENCGSTVLDSSGNGHTGIITGATWVNGKFGKALSFDENQDYVAATKAINIFAGDFTFSFWYCPLNGMNSASRLLTYYYNATNYFQFTNIGVFANNATFRLGGKLNSSTETGRASTTNLSWDRYYHIICGVKSGAYFLYYDTVLQSLSTSTGYGIGTNTGLTLGIRNDYTQNDLLGKLDNVNGWNRALSINEITRLYREPFCGYGRPMIELFSVSAGGGVTISLTHAEALCSAESPSVVLGGISVTIGNAESVAGAINPVTVLGSISLSSGYCEAICDTVNPTIVLGSISVSGGYAESIVSCVDPQIAGGGITISMSYAESVSSVVDPAIIFGSVSLGLSQAESIAETVSPGIVLGSLTLEMGYTESIVETVNPTVITSGLNLSPGFAESYCSTINPDIILGSISVNAGYAEAITECIDPSVIIPGEFVPALFFILKKSK